MTTTGPPASGLHVPTRSRRSGVIEHFGCKAVQNREEPGAESTHPLCDPVEPEAGLDGCVVELQGRPSVCAAGTPVVPVRPATQPRLQGQRTPAAARHQLCDHGPPDSYAASASEFAGYTHTAEAVTSEPRDRSSRHFTDYTYTA